VVGADHHGAHRSQSQPERLGRRTLRPLLSTDRRRSAEARTLSRCCGLGEATLRSHAAKAWCRMPQLTVGGRCSAVMALWTGYDTRGPVVGRAALRRRRGDGQQERYIRAAPHGAGRRGVDRTCSRLSPCSRSGHSPRPLALSRCANSGSDQLAARAVPTYASCPKQNPSPSSISGLEKLAVSEAIVVMAARRSVSERSLNSADRGVASNCNLT
jgi:hypothetical protein